MKTNYQSGFTILLILMFLMPGLISAQNKSSYFKVALSPESKFPGWANEMYQTNPDVFKVDSLYLNYYKENSFKKDIHTQNYKFWRRKIERLLGQNGRIAADAEQLFGTNDYFKTKRNLASRQNTFSSWNCIGPYETYNIATGTTRSNQVNVYCMAQSKSNSNILYAGTEAAGVYKSIDKGLNWNLVTANLPLITITGIEIDPLNSDIVYFSSNGRIYKTTDAGLNWTEIHNAGGDIFEFLIDQTNTQKVFAAGETGLLKSMDGGTSWTSVFSASCWDIDFKPGSVDTIYLLKNNSAAKIDELFRSDDGGMTWNIKNTGYYTPTVFAEASAIGGKIAVSEADPNIVYVALIGNAKAGDDGWIGLFKSNNSGDSWTNPSGQTGGPYNAAHPYMVGYSDGYHQGFYNFDLEVSDNNPSKIWIGSIFFYTSSDGGQTFQQISPHPHADHQDLDVNGTDIWIATDGGLDFSSDELQTFQSKKNGISGSDYWRLGSGWNEDILVGGRYHNGDAALFMPNYGAGQSLFLGAAEQGTGYLNPINNRLAIFSDLGASVLLPDNLNGDVSYLPALAMYPDEGYTLRRSELVFDCRYADMIYLGKNNQFWKSTDGGVNFNAIFTFANNAQVMEIEQSRSNPNIFYCSVFNNNNSGSTKGEIYKSVNGGNSWTKLSDIPSTYRREIQLAINPANENELWAGNIYGPNGQKVYRTTDAGSSWQNMTTTVLNGEEIRDIIFQPSTNSDLVYVATFYGVYYWDQNNWVNMSNGLPFIINTNEMQPFFRDSKLRLGAFGRAIWEAGMAADVRPLAQPITQRDSIYCPKDTVQFDCYSIVDHANTQWSWNITPAPAFISGLNQRNPKVVFGNSGNYTVSLSVTDGNGRTDSKTITDMVKVISKCSPDTIPGLALNCIDADDYAQTTPYNITTNRFTVSAWVKPDGIQDDYTAIVMNDGNDAAGFNFRGGNNTLGYHWPGGQWWWNSNLVVPSGEWSHVAMVANANTISLYLNGKAVSQNVNLSPTELTTFKIGNYRGWSGRNYKGLIDEVCIWNKALLQDEIRSLRHLTKENAVLSDSTLIGYYQFNEGLNQTYITDKAGTHHLNLSNGAQLGLSTAPVASGSSSKQTVNSGGFYVYQNEGIEMNFGNAVPNGDLWVSKLRLYPDSLANAANHDFQTYWILNNYGQNSTFAIDSFRLYPMVNNLSQNAINNPNMNQLFVRDAENEHLSNWNFACEGAYAGSAPDFVSFDNACNLNSSGQIYLASTEPITNVNQTVIEKTNVFPNPVKNEQFINISGLEGRTRFKLFDVGGKLILDKIFDCELSGTQIILPALSEGAYLYSIENEKRLSSGKIVIMK